MGSLVTFGCCARKELGLEFVGVISEGGSKKQSGICQVTYPTSSVAFMSFRSCSLPAPVFYICYLGNTLL